MCVYNKLHDNGLRKIILTLMSAKLLELVFIKPIRYIMKNVCIYYISYVKQLASTELYTVKID